MSGIESAYLTLVILAACLFAAALGYQAWRNRQH
jgi:hypothetical protein